MISGIRQMISHIDRAENGDAGQHMVDEFGRALARPDARNEAAMLLQIVGRLDRIEHDRGVEEAKKTISGAYSNMNSGRPWPR